MTSGQKLQSVRDTLPATASAWARYRRAARVSSETLARLCRVATVVLFAWRSSSTLRSRCNCCRSPGSSSAVSGSGAPVSASAVRPSDAICGRVPAGSSDCSRPTRHRTASTSVARRTSTRPSSRTPSRSTVPTAGLASTSSPQDPSRPCRPGTATRRPRPRVTASSAATMPSPDSNHRWPPRSAPTRPRSPRHRQVAVEAAVAEEAAVEEAAVAVPGSPAPLTSLNEELSCCGSSWRS